MIDLESQLRHIDKLKQSVFSDTLKRWPKHISGNTSLVDLSQKWGQDNYGNWIIQTPLSVTDFKGNNKELKIAIPHNTWITRDGDLNNLLLQYALGKRKDAQMIDKGGRSWGAKIKWNSLELALVYILDISDIDGVERLAHSDLLNSALVGVGSNYRIARPIFATTNFYVSRLVSGTKFPPEGMDMTWKMHDLAEDLNRIGMWDPRIKIDKWHENFLLAGNGMVYNIDPVSQYPY